MTKKICLFSIFIVLVFSLVNFNNSRVELTRSADAAGGVVKSATGTAPDRYVYYPGTENLSKNEIRVVACGTGMPASRKGQAASCWLMEFGNGDKFYLT